MKVTLFKEKLNDRLNKRQKKTLNLIREKPGIQVKILSKELNIPIDTLDRYIKILTNKDLIERKGSKKTGGYFVK